MSDSATTEAPRDSRREEAARWMRGMTGRRMLDVLAENGFIAIFAIWVAFLSIATDAFLTEANILVVLRQAAVTGIVAIGTTMIMLLGAIDISFGGVLAVGGVVAALLLVDSQVAVVVALLAAVGVGLVVGIVNGLVVTKLRINAVIATLGMLSMLEGAAFILAGGKTIYGPELGGIAFLSKNEVLGIPVPVILLFALYLAAWVLLTQTTFGARLYAVGNNDQASFLSGIRVDRVKVAAFAVAGALAGFAGVMQVSRLGSAQGGMGADFMFPVLTAVVLGGVSLAGGKGRVQNTLIAAVFLTTITNGMILLDVSGYAQRIVSGAILILALSLDRLRRSTA